MWIAHIPYSESNGRLRSLYDRIKGPDGNIDNIMLAHSLRAHSMEGHMALYKYVLHHSGNVTPKWFLEALGVHVSLLNGCDYCVEHHFAGLRRLLKDDFRATVIRSALERVDFADNFSRAGARRARLRHGADPGAAADGRVETRHSRPCAPPAWTTVKSSRSIRSSPISIMPTAPCSVSA